ncbi:MAG: hypothetical protein IH946_03020 [Bacteroidetes bacterium]|nr:hypothetical protein [Bacteroidota bacterium]
MVSQLTFFLIMFLLPILCQAQGWLKSFGGSGIDVGFDIVSYSKDRLMIIGTTTSFGAGGKDIYCVNLKTNGDTIWTKTFGGPLDDVGTAITKTYDNGFVIAGYSKNFGGPNNAYLLKIDSLGNVVWDQDFGSATHNEILTSVIQSNDSGFVAVGIDDFGGSKYYTVKVDSSGNQIWAKALNYDFSGSYYHLGFSHFSPTITQISNGEYRILGGVVTLGNDLLMIKMTEFGAPYGTSSYSTFGLSFNYPQQVIQLPGDDLMFIGSTWNTNGNTDFDFIIIKVASNGNEHWRRIFTSKENQVFFDGVYNSDSTITLVGLSEYYQDSTSGELVVININNKGSVNWNRVYGGIDADGGYGIIQLSNGGYAVCGITTTSGTNRDVYVIKMDSLGYTFPNYVTGYIYHDTDSNCIFEQPEQTFRRRIVVANPGNISAITDKNGRYVLNLDTGNYNIVTTPINDLWRIECPPQQVHSVDVDTQFTTINSLNFSNNIRIVCPRLAISIGTNRHRICPPNYRKYIVNYCNEGTEAVIPIIEIEFDSLIQVLSSTLPWSTQGGNIYTFHPDSSDLMECDSFQIKYKVSCSATFGQMLCTKANIYPDSTCMLIDSTWEGSSLSVYGQCIGDSLIDFVVHNIAVSNMSDSSEYRIYENDSLLGSHSFKLTGQDSLIHTITANCKTYRIEVDQNPGHPGSSMPRDFVELCACPDSLPINPANLGHLDNWPTDDLDLAVDIECHEVTGSWDPNDKSVKPPGIEADRLITNDQVLQYHINFQNTGTDTAYRIVIKDTISEYLNLASIKPGPSSHEYELEIINNKVLVWSFNKINLVDSNTNEAESHGFLRFTIAQIDNNPPHTKIENRAGIYFDFNPAVITNTAFNTIYEPEVTFVPEEKINKPISYKEQININVYPNPFNDQAKVIIQVLDKSEAYQPELILYDQLGREARRIEPNAVSPQHEWWFNIDRGQLPAGFYFFSIKNNHTIVGIGKLVVQ